MYGSIRNGPPGLSRNGPPMLTITHAYTEMFPRLSRNGPPFLDVYWIGFYYHVLLDSPVQPSHIGIYLQWGWSLKALQCHYRDAVRCKIRSFSFDYFVSGLSALHQILPPRSDQRTTSRFEGSKRSDDLVKTGPGPKDDHLRLGNIAVVHSTSLTNLTFS